MKKYEDTLNETFWDSHEEALKQTVWQKAEALRQVLVDEGDSKYTKDPESLDNNAIKQAMLELNQAIRGDFVQEWRSVNKK